MKYAYEPAFTIYNEDTHEVLTVKEDSDGLGLVALQDIDEDGKVRHEVRFGTEAIEHLVKALRALRAHLEEEGRA